jgi:hypothetical protein
MCDYNYMFRPPGPSSGCVKDVSKINYTLLVSIMVVVGNKNKKGGRGRKKKEEEGANEISFYSTIWSFPLKIKSPRVKSKCIVDF